MTKLGINLTFQKRGSSKIHQLFFKEQEYCHLTEPTFQFFFFHTAKRYTGITKKQEFPGLCLPTAKNTSPHHPKFRKKKCCYSCDNCQNHKCQRRQCQEIISSVYVSDFCNVQLMGQISTKGFFSLNSSWFVFSHLLKELCKPGL